MALSSASWSALFHGRHLVYTLLVTLSVGMHAIGIHMLATVLPSIVADLGGAAFYAWATLLYTIASIIGTVCGGLVTARLDLRRAYLVGALVLLGGAVGCATAPHIAVLLLARTLQGLGSGLLVAIAYSMVSELYADALRARVLSAISGIWGVAALLGPMLGGMFAASGGIAFGAALAGLVANTAGLAQTSHPPRSPPRRPGSPNWASSLQPSSLSWRGVWYGSSGYGSVAPGDRMSEQSIDRAMY